MKTLIVEDDFTNRVLLQECLKDYGPVHIAVNGKEALNAVVTAMDIKEPYDLICMDIMMPEMDGQVALKSIRAFEESHGIRSTKGAKIVMTTALVDFKNISNAFHGLCDGYLVKPIDMANLVKMLREFNLID